MKAQPPRTVLSAICTSYHLKFSSLALSFGVRKRTADLEHHHDVVEDRGGCSEPPMSTKKRTTSKDPNRYSTAATYAESTDSLSMSPEQLVAQTQYHGARGATRSVTPGTNITQTQVGYQASSWEVIAGNLGLLHNPRDVQG